MKYGIQILPDPVILGQVSGLLLTSLLAKLECLLASWAAKMSLLKCRFDFTLSYFYLFCLWSFKDEFFYVDFVLQ